MSNPISEILKAGKIVTVYLLTEVPLSNDISEWKIYDGSGSFIAWGRPVVQRVFPNLLSGVLQCTFSPPPPNFDGILGFGVSYISVTLFYGPIVENGAPNSKGKFTIQWTSSDLE